MKKILVPTDFSEQAAYALDLAAQIARKTNAKLYLLHIIEPIKSYVAATDGMYIDASVEQKYINYLKENAQEHMEKVLKHIPKEIETETIVTLGTIFSTINEQIEKDEIDLLVMGTQGVSGLDEFLIGSNTEKVVRIAKCPVLTVKNKVNIGDLKKIIFATNLNIDQVPIIQDLSDIVQLFDAELTLLFINVPHDFYTERQILKKMEEFVSASQLDDFKFHIYSELNEESGMIYYAEDEQINLIAVATHQRTGMAHIITGSIAENVVNHASQPVLTFGLKHPKKQDK